jgi:two-component system, cell cycle sensor histidine kinase and response regulator CckA
MPEKIPQKIKVLLVEDEEALLYLLASVLRQAGLDVLAALSPSEALELWAEHNNNVDVLITDLIMDGMNGFELAEKLRLKKAGLHVICMTGYGLDMLTKQMAQHPDFTIMQKPFRPRDLVEAARERLHPTSLAAG